MTSHLTSSPLAAETAAQEAAIWMEVARSWHPGRQPIEDVPPNERAVVRLYDPRSELQRHGRQWGYEFITADLSDLARFAAALARTESEAWATDRGHLATRAYQERRFLLGDRILHWAIPWLDAVSHEYPAVAGTATATKDRLLDLADHHRPAPALAGSEGLVVPGFDGYGPLNQDIPFERLLISIWSGTVLLNSHLAEVFGEQVDRDRLPPTWDSHPGARAALESGYIAAADRWDRLAVQRPGSAQLWRDLANRARRTAGILNRWKPYRDISDEY